VIESGHVVVIDRSFPGKEENLLILKKGEAFPLIWGFDHPTSVVYSYKSLAETRLLRSSLKDFKIEMGKEASFTKDAMEMFVHLTWDTLERLKGMHAPYTYEKLLRLLPYIASKVGSKVDNRIYSIPKNLGQQLIADMLGSSRESVSVHYNEAIKNGVIIKKENGDRFIDLEKVPEQYIYSRWFNES
jgi:CRP-like cAMP-binding protein